ncbi:hypothetical protein LXA43DRAFT_1068902 [Ganoderma leucocontextum]|nr:hypothetical protein LXA43DRAFT_1068902 [Ganoderma leucocontextum]
MPPTTTKGPQRRTSNRIGQLSTIDKLTTSPGIHNTPDAEPTGELGTRLSRAAKDTLLRDPHMDIITHHANPRQFWLSSQTAWSRKTELKTLAGGKDPAPNARKKALKSQDQQITKEGDGAGVQALDSIEPPKRKRRSTHNANIAGGLSSTGEAHRSNTTAPEKPANKKLKVDDQPSSDTRAICGSRATAHDQFQAPRIDVNQPLSDEEAKLPPKLRRGYRKPKGVDDKPDGHDNINEDGEDKNPDGAMEADEDESGGEREDREMGGAVDIVAESHSFSPLTFNTVHGFPSHEQAAASSRSPSRASSTPSLPDSAHTSENNTSDTGGPGEESEASGSEHTDPGDAPDNGEEEMGAVTQVHCNYAIVRKTAGKKLSHHKKKLRDELPQIVPSSSRRHTAPAHSTKDGEARPWLPCTNISDVLSTASGKSWKIGKTGLRSEMSGVVDEGIRLATIALQFESYDIDTESMQYTPFGVQGLEQYALDPLISAAENLKYDGENDITHQLEAGSSTEYIDPLCAYVAKRLRSYRLTIKAAALQTIPMLLERSNFIFPRTAQGDFNRAKPFSGDGFAEVIKVAFYTQQQYHDIGLKTVHLLRSTSPHAPHELEIPPTMLALAATAIEAVITDRVNHTTSDFTGQGLHQSFMAHLQDILDFCTNRPAAYHALMHGTAIAVMDGTVHTQSIGGGHQGHSRIDWDSIVEPTEPDP